MLEKLRELLFIFVLVLLAEGGFPPITHEKREKRKRGSGKKKMPFRASGLLK
ncbi:MAG: hypothetical protein NTV24_04615 [Candidatus Woesebacteria bacterium]|nr:hypothetical protein [Candidatus Woesebacteria bacterium]